MRSEIDLSTKLSLSFYQRNTKLVARELIGKILVHRLANGKRLSGRIVETEAYLGIKDPACHAFGDRRTTRTEPLYLDGGHAYIYFIYGIHFCFNVVTRTLGHPEAVLIRALEPLEGIETMFRLRGCKKERDLSSGPGKLCQALKIDRKLNGASLIGDEIFILEGKTPKKSEVVSSRRIGIDYAGDAVSWPLRFHLKDSPHVSRI
jgi:DNA-3-methyladenine glycosylase